MRAIDSFKRFPDAYNDLLRVGRIKETIVMRGTNEDEQTEHIFDIATARAIAATLTRLADEAEAYERQEAGK